MEISKNLYENLKMARAYFKIFKHSDNIETVASQQLTFGKYNKIRKMNSDLTNFAYETFKSIISKKEVDKFLHECESLKTGYTLDGKYFRFIDELLGYVVATYRWYYED